MEEKCLRSSGPTVLGSQGLGGMMRDHGPVLCKDTVSIGKIAFIKQAVQGHSLILKSAKKGEVTMKGGGGGSSTADN